MNQGGEKRIAPKAGDRIKASDIRGIASSVPVSIMGGGNGVRVNKVGSRLSISQKNDYRNWPVIMAFRVESTLSGDYLVCRPVAWNNAAKQNIANPSAAVLVARPHHLQYTPWHNKYIYFQDSAYTVRYSYTDQKTRTATRSDTNESETQHLTPEYFSGDIIVAIRCPGPLFVSEDEGLADGKIYWVDLNNAGRCWAVDGDDAEPDPVAETTTPAEPSAPSYDWDEDDEAYLDYLINEDYDFEEFDESEIDVIVPPGEGVPE